MRKRNIRLSDLAIIICKASRASSYEMIRQVSDELAILLQGYGELYG